MQRSQVGEVERLRTKPFLLTIVDFKLQVRRYERWLNGAQISTDDMVVRKLAGEAHGPNPCPCPDIGGTLGREFAGSGVQLARQKQ
jgi:hypothetical protein